MVDGRGNRGSYDEVLQTQHAGTRRCQCGAVVGAILGLGMGTTWARPLQQPLCHEGDVKACVRGLALVQPRCWAAHPREV